MKLMQKLMVAASVSLVAVPMAMPTAAAAQDQEWPLIGGEYSDMTGIYIEDGGSLLYAQYLAGEWARNQEFAKSQGWISDYAIYANVNRRDGEPHLYLVVTYPSVPDAAEGERRGDAFEAWSNRTIAEQEAASGNRAQFRTVRGSIMLQELMIR